MLDFYKGNLDWLKTNTIYLAKHGSHAYGLNTPASDLDIRGIAIPPQKYFYGFINTFEQTEQKEPDLVIYGIVKFFKLAADCNPNIIELLWIDDEDIIYEDEFGFFKNLKDNRDLFLSKKARHTFSGYAHAQLKRIRTHKKWLLKPPDHKPTREEYQLPNSSVLSADIMGAIESVEKSNPEADLNSQFGPLVMQTYQRERTYFNVLREWQQYETWKRNRNPARASLETKFGYDTKHAMHLVRLMTMCKEILTLNKVIVKRPDREQLLAIRDGIMNYDELIEWAENQDKEIELLAEQSTLPNSPDRNRLDEILVYVVKNYLMYD